MERNVNDNNKVNKNDLYKRLNKLYEDCDDLLHKMKEIDIQCQRDTGFSCYDNCENIFCIDNVKLSLKQVLERIPEWLEKLKKNQALYTKVLNNPNQYRIDERTKLDVEDELWYLDLKIPMIEKKLEFAKKYKEYLISDKKYKEVLKEIEQIKNILK